MDGILILAGILSLFVIAILSVLIYKLKEVKLIDRDYHDEYIAIYSFLLGSSLYILFSIIRHFIINWDV